MRVGHRQCRFILNEPPARPICCGAPVADGSWAQRIGGWSTGSPSAHPEADEGSAITLAPGEGVDGAGAR